MTIERNAGIISFCCDVCGEVEDTESFDFTIALSHIRREGWFSIKDEAGDWVHLCSGHCRARTGY